MIKIPRWDIKIWRGTDFSEKYTFLQSKGGPAEDFTGKTLAAHLRKQPDHNSTLIDEFTVDVTEIASGIVYLKFTKAETAALSGSIGYYDIVETVTATDISTVRIYGEVSIEDAKTYTAP
jgi:hypothetical protein